jgi:hypothetical protein
MCDAPSNAEPRISAGFHPLTSLEFFFTRWRIHQNEIGKAERGFSPFRADFLRSFTPPLPLLR